MIGSTKSFNKFFAEMGWGKPEPRSNGLKAKRRNKRLKVIEAEIDNEWARRLHAGEAFQKERAGHGGIQTPPAPTKQRGR